MDFVEGIREVLNRYISERLVKLSRYFSLHLNVPCPFLVLSIQCGKLSGWRKNIPMEKEICGLWKIFGQRMWGGLKEVRFGCIYKDKTGWIQLHWLHFKLFRQISRSMEALREPWNLARWFSWHLYFQNLNVGPHLLGWGWSIGQSLRGTVVNFVAF